jgi:hypothetical protein
MEETKFKRLIGFRKSHTKNKKYDAIVGTNKGTKIIPFSDSRYQHFKDATGLGLYSHLDHNNQERRKNYRSRHSKIMKDDKPAYLNKLSPAYFSYNFLW